MITIHSYPVAVAMSVVTMICWGSWANTQKLSGGKAWSFQLFYWDYAIGVFLFSLLLALTAGSLGHGGRPFLTDLFQARENWLLSAFLGGCIFNLSNILLVAAIDIAGMAVAFPIGIGLALVLGVATTYWNRPEGNVPMLALGAGCIIVATVLDALAYKKMALKTSITPTKGIVLSIIAGSLMGLFYSFVAGSMGRIDVVTDVLESGKLSPYTAIVCFSTGVLASNLVWNSIVMARPFVGAPVTYRDYFTKGTPRLHLIGILGGVIWNIGMSFSIMASSVAGAALSYGLGQGATMIGALWGVFVWKEFQGAPRSTNGLLAAMFFFYLLGLTILIASKT